MPRSIIVSLPDRTLRSVSFPFGADRESPAAFREMPGHLPSVRRFQILLRIFVHLWYLSFDVIKQKMVQKPKSTGMHHFYLSFS